MKGNEICLRSSLLELLLPLETNIEIATSSLQTLEKILCAFSSENIGINQWKTLVSTSEIDISVTVTELVYKLCSEFYHRSDCLSSASLVFALFLQNINSRRKLRIQDKSKKTLEKVLEDFISSSLDVIQQIFSEPKRLNKILELVFCNYTADVPLDQIVDLLSRDPHSVSSCVKNGKKLVWKLSNPGTSSLARMATTAHLASSSGRKRMVLSQLVRQVLAKSSETVTNSSVFVHRCSQSKLFFPTFLRSLDVVKSKHCTIVCGPIKRTLKVTGCKNMIIVAMAKRVIIQDCKDCTLFLCTPTHPLLSSSCQNITFAPYNLSYNQLSKDIESASFKPLTVNFWNEPIVVRANQNLTPTYNQCFEVMETARYERVLYPFTNVSDCATQTAFEVPIRYKEVLQFQDNKLEGWETTKKVASLSEKQEQTLLGLIEEDFKKFLEETAADLDKYVESMTDFTLII